MGLFSRKTKDANGNKVKSKKANDTTVSQDTKRYEATAAEIINLGNSYHELSDEELKAKIDKVKQRALNGESLDALLVETYATVYASATRVLGMTPYRVQVIGALSMHQGNVAEMRTGEGKTLTSTMPIVLNALKGNGVHVVTVNDYLAHRDSEEMGELFNWLGFSVGLNARGNKLSKKLAYGQDITYTTNSELGFDYLRDNMVKKIEDKVQRGLNYAIIDEADSVLIDEARTPLIISGKAGGNTQLFATAAKFVEVLKEEHYNIDIESKTISLSTEGAKFAEKGFNIKNLYEKEHGVLVHHIQQALKAKFIMQLDVEYIVEGGKIVIIDQATGRKMPGRAFSDGLNQALEAKHGLQVRAQAKTVATTTYQNFFRMYDKLAGMTGTAKTEEEEFLDVYNMKVEVIPTNLPIARVDAVDYVYGRAASMKSGLVEEVKELHAKGQPILIGTRSVEVSEELSKMLTEAGLAHETLNAKNHERESEIILGAGQLNKITIATNMAGRGTDIKLGAGVVEAGGLAVIGCERHESRRVDNQLIGRAGRQGDIGYSRFHVSFEDEMFLRYGGKAALKNAKRLGDGRHESSMLTGAITVSQKRIEGGNYDARKNTVKYDDVIRQQRDIMYKQRDAALESTDLEQVSKIMYNTVAKTAVNSFLIYPDKEAQVDADKLLLVAVQKKLLEEGQISKGDISAKAPEFVIERFREELMKNYYDNLNKIGKEEFLKVERRILIDIIDKNWQNHIDTMTKLRAGIHLRSYAQRNPLEAYVSEGFKLFEELKVTIAHQIVFTIKSIKIKDKVK